MNYLNAVFWDYPQFANAEYLKEYIHKAKGKNMYFWILRRFLEYGRVVDVINFFTVEEIKEYLLRLNLSPYTTKKYKRIIEVYASHKRK